MKTLLTTQNLFFLFRRLTLVSTVFENTKILGSFFWSYLLSRKFDILLTKVRCLYIDSLLIFLLSHHKRSPSPHKTQKHTFSLSSIAGAHSQRVFQKFKFFEFLLQIADSLDRVDQKIKIEDFLFLKSPGIANLCISNKCTT